jgi:AcrR family transcriptional regulator
MNDAVGVAELGEGLGIIPPSFYAAFGSKAGLLERALKRYQESEANIFARAHAEGGSVADVHVESALGRSSRQNEGWEVLYAQRYDTGKLIRRKRLTTNHSSAQSARLPLP